MKKKFFGGLFILAIATVAVFNVNMHVSSDRLSLLNLANVEALASEDGDENIRKGLCDTKYEMKETDYPFCAPYDLYRSGKVTTESWSCQDGHYSHCKEAYYATGNDCNNEVYIDEETEYVCTKKK